ncbi:MAG TPA: biotin/lipoyl-containing protein [Candidatus Rubrimentiphilum sp.]|nr:biotin/lipoyl-containing protein [Candidatus Rubrimentiphilum sp.]
MSPDPLLERVRSLVRIFLETDLMRLRIESDGEHIELRRKVAPHAPRHRGERARKIAVEENTPPAEAIKADLVGIVHLSRPIPAQGEHIESDRELAYVEALGIRNPVRSLGPGRLVSICCHEGQPVEYGQVLFEIVRAS